LHGNHSWADCIYNPASPKYDETQFKDFIQGNSAAAAAPSPAPVASATGQKSWGSKKHRHNQHASTSNQQANDLYNPPATDTLMELKVSDDPDVEFVETSSSTTSAALSACGVCHAPCIVAFNDFVWPANSWAV
jgi:hypothetical protein